jgi:hypothetical protein
MPDFCSSGKASPPAPTKMNLVLMVRLAPVRRLRTLTSHLPSDCWDRLSTSWPKKAVVPLRTP